MTGWEPVADVVVDPRVGRVHEQGWQSWSPSATYALDERPHRPTSVKNHRTCYRLGVDAPVDTFQGEGLLAVEPGDGAPVTLVAAADGRLAVPSIRAEVDGDRVRVLAQSDADVDVIVDAGPNGIAGALARWAAATSARFGLAPPRPAPTVWCSWYHYFTAVTTEDVTENLWAMDRLGLDLDVVQLDDGYQRAIGDWLELSTRFESLPGIASRIHDHGRRAGIWVAPFLVADDSRVAREHPEWLVTGEDSPVDPGRNWHRRLAVLDVTHPEVQEHLHTVFATLRSHGFDYIKIDFVYAGAVEGRRREDISAIDAYRHGLRLIRDAIGDAYLLGCGAPLLPSIGLVDAMRVSPDTGPNRLPPDGDLSQPSSLAATITGQARAFAHGRFWINDPDCLIVRPAVEDRKAWADHVVRNAGLRASADRLLDLDDWGLRTTRELLQRPAPRLLVKS